MFYSLLFFICCVLETITQNYECLDPFEYPIHQKGSAFQCLHQKNGFYIKFNITNFHVIFAFLQENQIEGYAVSELQKRLDIHVSLSNRKQIIDELLDKEIIELASQAIGEKALTNEEVLDSEYY